MTRLSWGSPSERTYEVGVDRGVLYVGSTPGVPWTGLISVDESPSGGSVKSYHLDGEMYLQVSGKESFQGNISSYQRPAGFGVCDGLGEWTSGLIMTQQRRQSFGLSYRTRIGNALNSAASDYQIHILYNVLASPSSRRNSSINSSVILNTYNWKITARPELIGQGFRRTPHLVIDSRTTHPGVLADLEDILYGSPVAAPRLPLPEELMAMFEVGELEFTETPLTNPTRTLLEGTWGEAVFTLGARTVYVTTPEWDPRIFTQTDSPLVDEFLRTRSGTGWNIATKGGLWNHTGGTVPGNYSVVSGYGNLTMDTTAIARHAYIGDYDLTNQTVAASFGLSQKTLEEGGVGVGVALARVDDANNYRCRIEIDNPNIKDSFTRTASASGWGASTSGHTWSNNGGTGTDYTTSGTTGKIIISAKNSSRRITTGSAADGEVLVKVAPSEVATGGIFTVSAILRHKDASNHYLARLVFEVAGTTTLRLQAVTAGTVTDLTSETALPSPSYTIGTNFWIRAKILGSNLYAKAWKDGDAEPGSWLVTATNGTHTGLGALGLRGWAATGNTNPNTVNVVVDDFYAIVEDGKEVVVGFIQKQVAGTLTTLVTGTLGYFTEGTQWRVEGKHFGTSLEMRAWATTGSRPSVASLSITDATFTTGRSGVFAISKAGQATITASVYDFQADGVLSPASVTVEGRVYALTSPYTGEVDLYELFKFINNDEDDIIDIASKFMIGEPVVLDDLGYQIRGAAKFGPREADGDLISGSDFNDYMGRTWSYSGGPEDPADSAMLGSLDAAGFIRMVYGPVGAGIPVIDSGNDGNAIPRDADEQIDEDALGAEVIADTGIAPADISMLQIGDILGFAASSDAVSSATIDHVGVYLGLDSDGDPVFISSRMTPDGPSFSKTGGSSKLNDAGVYASRFRVARRF